MAIIFNCSVLNSENKKIIAFCSDLTENNFEEELELLIKNLIKDLKLENNKTIWLN